MDKNKRRSSPEEGKSRMIGKWVSFQNPNVVDDSRSGQIMDKLLSKHLNYYLIRFPDDSIRSIPCHWICNIINPLNPA